MISDLFLTRDLKIGNKNLKIGNICAGPEFQGKNLAGIRKAV
jgi:hypothetical protein